MMIDDYSYSYGTRTVALRVILRDDTSPPDDPISALLVLYSSRYRYAYYSIPIAENVLKKMET